MRELYFSLIVFIVFSSAFTLEIQNIQKATLWNETYEKGQVLQIDDLNVYIVGSKNNAIKNMSIIVVYDIFGFNISQTRVFCDRLSAEYEVQVAMPDFFRGKTASSHMGNLTTVLSLIGNWSQIALDLDNVVKWLHHTSPAHRIAIIGFCWGGLQVARACSNLSTIFFGGISIHGAWLIENEVRSLKKPVFFIAAGNDPPLQPNISSVIEQWTSSKVSRQCQYDTYPNMSHGFVATGANYANPDNVEAIDRVHQTVRQFLDRISENSVSSKSHSINVFPFLLLLILQFGLTLYPP